MEPSPLDIGTIVAVASLAVTLIGYIIRASYKEGQKDQRLNALEGKSADTDCKQELAVLTAKFEGMEQKLGELGHDIKNLLTGRIIPARRGRADND